LEKEETRRRKETEAGQDEPDVQDRFVTRECGEAEELESKETK
jgi:hypothetical protein